MAKIVESVAKLIEAFAMLVEVFGNLDLFSKFAIMFISFMFFGYGLVKDSHHRLEARNRRSELKLKKKKYDDQFKADIGKKP